MRTGRFPPERRNPFDMDLRINQSFELGEGYGDRVLELLGLGT